MGKYVGYTGAGKSRHLRNQVTASVPSHGKRQEVIGCTENTKEGMDWKDVTEEEWWAFIPYCYSKKDTRLLNIKCTMQNTSGEKPKEVWEE